MSVYSEALAKHLASLGGTVLVAVSAIAPAALAQEAAQPSARSLGTVNFEVACQTQVADDFNRALALLHHMQYEESRSAFSQILAADPDCAMAHWGVAMTLFQPLWPSRPTVDMLKQGLAEIQTAQALGIESDRNAALVAATAAFYREPETADWWTRIRRWHEAMQEAFEAHPTDIETAAFYALSQLAVGQIEADQLAYNGQAAETLRQIYEREPAHPGAIHYTIHANDIDARASESLDVVRSYGEIAPEVPHALHMPTHIFVRLGYWPEVIDWNRRSADAALNFPAADGLSHHYPHALDYLVYAYLQQANDEAAQAVLAEVLERQEPFQGTFISAFHLASMPARYAVERRAWHEALAIEPATPATLAWESFFWPEALSWFAKGLGAVHMDDADQAETAEQRLIALRDLAQEAGEAGFATYIEIDRLVLSSWRAYGNGQSDTALALGREAIALEATIQKHPVTPGSIYPAQESLGDLLLALNRPQEALAAYEDSLVTWPGRFNTILGAARAAAAAGSTDQAIRYYEDLLVLSAGSDSSRLELAGNSIGLKAAIARNRAGSDLKPALPSRLTPQI